MLCRCAYNDASGRRFAADAVTKYATHMNITAREMWSYELLEAVIEGVTAASGATFAVEGHLRAFKTDVPSRSSSLLWGALGIIDW